MALNYRYIGDTPNEFRVYTDGARVQDINGNILSPNELLVTEIRGRTEFDVANGMDIGVLENTRGALFRLAADHGYQIEEWDDEENLNISTRAPIILTYNPARGGTAPALTSNIVLSFSINIAKATATGPTVRLYNLTANTLVETFAFNSTAITVSGAAATINPTANFVTGNIYALLIDGGYFTNSLTTAIHGGIHHLGFYNFTAP